MASSQSKKKSQGRQKIEMKLIENENARRTTFSKRRVGIFKKATELTTLCGAQIGLIIFSICGRAYSFGNPCGEWILGRLCGGNLAPVRENPARRTILQNTGLQKLKEDCDRVNEEIERKKKRGKEVREILDKSTIKVSEEDLSELSLIELKEVREEMKGLKERMRRCTRPRPRQGLKSVNGVHLGKVEMDGSDASHWLKL